MIEIEARIVPVGKRDEMLHRPHILQHFQNEILLAGMHKPHPKRSALVDLLFIRLIKRFLRLVQLLRHIGGILRLIPIVRLIQTGHPHPELFHQIDIFLERTLQKHLQSVFV